MPRLLFLKIFKKFSNPKLIILGLAIFFSGIYLLTSTAFLQLFRPEFDTSLSLERRAYVYEKMIEAFQKLENPCETQMGYCRRPETQHVDCGQVLRGDKPYLESLTGSNRIPLIPDPYLNMTCTSIKHRIHPEHLQYTPLKLRGTAFGRIVYKDYEFIEKQIQVNYHPQNLFCFVLDQKSEMEFQDKMKKLGECLPNVIVLPATESYDSNGHNDNIGHYRCMEVLLSYPDWGYMVLLHNHDVITKSVYELDRIFELLGGANDIPAGVEISSRRPKGMKWDPKSLKLFRNESGIPDEILNSEMKFATGYAQASLTREAVEWLVRDVDLTILIGQWNQSDYAGDEQYLASLSINSAYGMPGHFTDECVQQKIPVIEITRNSHWANGDPNKCATKAVRHEMCIFGIEDFRAVAELPTLMFNKMIPSFDYSIVECTAELLYNRTFLGQVDTALNETYFENLVTVQYHKHGREPGYVINCTSDYGPYNYENYL